MMNNVVFQGVPSRQLRTCAVADILKHVPQCKCKEETASPETWSAPMELASPALVN